MISTTATLKKLTTVVALSCLFLFSRAQFYAFTKSTGSYTEISGGTTLINNNWDDFSVLFKTPFPFRFFTSNIFDSIEVVDWGGIYFNNINNGYFDAYSTDLNSRGNGKSAVSWVNEGTGTSHILKIQFHNAGFAADAPNHTDSVNFQIWIYQTSDIIEFRYGPNSVKPTSYGGDVGPYIQIADPLSIAFNFIVLEGNPANPTIRTVDISKAVTMTGTPANGTIYRFTPSAFHTGIQKINEYNLSIQNNQLVIPAALSIETIEIHNMNGQLVQSYLKTAEVDLSTLPHGIYVVSVKCNEGVIRQKMVL